MRGWMDRTALAALLVVAAGVTAAHAGWQDEATAYDVKRISLLDESKSRGLSEAQSGPDGAMIRSVVESEAVSTSERSLVGSWRCRTIKLGGLTSDVVYSWFRCRISERDGGLTFEKVSGTQRLRGRLYENGSGGYVLLGAYSAKREPWHTYSGNTPSMGASATPDDAAGVLVATGSSSARIELPYPMQESVFDVIELRR